MSVIPFPVASPAVPDVPRLARLRALVSPCEICEYALIAASLALTIAAFTARF